MNELPLFLKRGSMLPQESYQPVNTDLQNHIHSVVDRTRAFLRATEPGHFLVTAGFPAETKTAPPLSRLNLEDPQVGSNMKNLEAILKATGDRALMLSGSPGEIIPRLDLLATRNVCLRACCADRNEAESLVAAVRKHSKSSSPFP